MGIFGKVSGLSLLGPLGGLVAGIQNTNWGQTGGSNMPGILSNVSNIAKNFGVSTTRPASAFSDTPSDQSLVGKTAYPTGGGTYTTTQPTNTQSYSQPSSGSTDTGGDTGGQYVDPYADLRNDISSGWDSYLGSLDQQLYGLTGQRTSQESIANSQFNQGLGDLDLQKTQGFQQLGTQRQQAEQNQAKNLRDLGANLKNSFMAGNVYLGSRGAGDSSAANQYAFALTKMGSRQRGDIMNNTSNILSDIAGRETNLTNIYNTEKNKLQEALNQQIQGIAQWFANAQNTIQMQKAQGQLNKSQDLASLSKEILNYAMGQLQTVQQAAQQRQAGLESWAMSNSQNLAQLKQNMGAISSPSYQMPQASAITGTPQFTSDGRIYVPTGYGSDTEKKKTTLFG